eukprot:scaffold229945_cov61-Attheya_sp.AAC.2
MMTSKAVAVTASLSTGIHPPAKKRHGRSYHEIRTLKRFCHLQGRHPGSTSSDDGDKARNQQSSKRSSNHVDAVQRNHKLTRMMNAPSYEEEKMYQKLPSKKSAKAPMRVDPDASDKSSDEEDKMDKKLLSKKSCKPPLGALPPSPDDDSDDGDEMCTKWRFPTTGSQRIMAMPAGEGIEMVELTTEQLLEDSASDTLNNNLLVPHPVVDVVDNKGSKRKKEGTVKASKPTKVNASKVPKVKIPKPPKVQKKKKPTLKTGVVRTNVGFELSLINKSVCFGITGPYDLVSYVGEIPESAKVFLDSVGYIYGAVVFHGDNGRYKIEWENTQLKAITMDSEGIFYGVQLAQTNAPLWLLLDHESMKETAQQSFKAFIHAFEDNDNPAEIELDSEGEEDVTTEEDRDRRKPPHDDVSPGYASIPSSQARMRFDTSQHMNPVESTSNTPEKIQNITWRCDTELPEHPQRSSFGATNIKAEAVSKFDTPVNSFLAFLPISIWETMVEYSNINAQQKKKAHPKHWISGHPWKKHYV